MKKIVVLTGILCAAQILSAQPYDTYGRSQSTREWQEYERHHASVSPSSGAAKDESWSLKNFNFGGNYSGPYVPFDFSIYKKKKKTAAEIEEERRQAVVQKKRRDSITRLQEIDDMRWDAEIRDYQKNVRNGNDEKLSYNKRLASLNKAAAYLDSVNAAVRKIWKEESRPGKPYQSSLDVVNYVKAAMFLEYKRTDEAYKYFRLALEEPVNIKGSINKINLYTAYCALLVDPDKAEILNRCNKIDTQQPSYIHYTAYALFLNNETGKSIAAYENYLTANKNLENISELNILSLTVAMQLINNQPQQALALYNSKSAEKFDDPLKLMKHLEYLLTVQIGEDIELYNFRYAVWTYFQLDVLCLLNPANTDAQKLRYKIAEEVNNKRGMMPVNQLINNNPVYKSLQLDQ